MCLSHVFFSASVLVLSDCVCSVRWFCGSLDPLWAFRFALAVSWSRLKIGRLVLLKVFVAGSPSKRNWEIVDLNAILRVCCVHGSL
jgi:hypothetical protein